MDKPIVLCEYSSKSNPGKKYHIIQAKDKSLYCDCWQWKRTRDCAHLRDFNDNSTKVPEGSQVIYDNDGELLVAIDKAISELS